ncbi:MAG: TonB-dependent receptor domain-containing protein [Longimicrobiaceae bacterium]
MLAITLATLWLQAGGSVAGTVRADSSHEPVAHARVTLVESGRSATADEHGYYVLTRVSPGERRVHVTAPGYGPGDTAVAVASSGSTRLDVFLPRREIILAGITATAGAVRSESVAGPGALQVDAQRIQTTPGIAEPDVLRTVQNLPSVAAISDFSTALYVRGGSPDQTLLTLDGAPLFNPYHLAGLVSALDPDAVAGVDVYSGDLPAELGDRLSGVVAVRTREGGRDRVRTSGAVSLLSSRASVDGPLPGGGGTFLLSARRSYVDLVTAATSAVGLTGDFPYSFGDAHAKVTHGVGRDGRLSASLYVNDEQFRLPERWSVGRARWGWGSTAASLGYRQPLGSRFLVDATLAWSRFGGTLDLRDSTPDALVRTRMSDVLAAVRLTHYTAGHRTTLGGQVDAYALSHQVRDSVPGGLSVFLSPLDRSDQPRTFAAFVSDEWTLSDRLRARAGVRALHVADGPTVWMPRAGLRVGIAPRWAVTLGGGRYAQVVHTLRDEESVAASFFAYDLQAAFAPADAPETGEDAVAGVEWGSGGATLRLEAYTKRFHDLAVAPLAPDPLNAPALAADDAVRGDGRAHGVELLAQVQRGPRTLSFAYVFSHTTRNLGDAEFAPRFDRKHRIDASGVLPVWSRLLLSSRLQLMTGQPYTPVRSLFQSYQYDPAKGGLVFGGNHVVYGEHNSDRLPMYLRLDLALRGPVTRRWFGRTGTVTPYAQVLNVTGARNVLWASGSTRPGGRAALEYGPQAPVLPTVGFEWKF